MSELFAIVDEEDNVVGKVSREECHRRRLIHRSVYILLFNARGELLIHRRAMSKDVYPGFYTGSVTGHVDYGETYDEAAKRELREELGIEAPLEKIAKFRSFSEVEKEISWLYACRYGGEIHPDPEEIIETRFVSLEELAEDIALGRREYTNGFKEAFREYIWHVESKPAP